MVYLRIMPFGLRGGNQDTTTLVEEEGTALMPAGGPGTRRKDIATSAWRASICVCVFVFVQAHAGCWIAIKVNRLFFADWKS